MTIIDMRGKLAVNNPNGYETRPLSQIRECDIHYTASPYTATVEAIAQYQTSASAAGQTGAGVPFPGIAYTYVVPADGNPRLCHDLGVRTWHNGAPGRNTLARAICFVGDGSPNAAQIRGIAEALVDMEKKLGRKLDNVQGHKDHYSTSCPGPGWPGWKANVMAEYNRLKAGGSSDSSGEEVNPGWQSPGFSEMWTANKSLMGVPTTQPYPYGADDVRQDSASGTAIWVKKSNRNFFLPLDRDSPPISI